MDGEAAIAALLSHPGAQQWQPPAHEEGGNGYGGRSISELTSEELLREYGGGLWQLHATTAGGRSSSDSGGGVGGHDGNLPDGRAEAAAAAPSGGGYWQADVAAAAAAMAVGPGGGQHRGAPEAAADDQWGWQQQEQQLRNSFMWQHPAGGGADPGAQLTQASATRSEGIQFYANFCLSDQMITDEVINRHLQRTIQTNHSGAKHKDQSLHSTHPNLVLEAELKGAMAVRKLVYSI